MFKGDLKIPQGNRGQTPINFGTVAGRAEKIQESLVAIYLIAVCARITGAIGLFDSEPERPVCFLIECP